VRAGREVLNERGYSGMTFQAIAKRTDLSRPTLHYYFATREDLFEAIADEARSVVSFCVGEALQSASLLGRLSGFIDAVRQADSRDSSMIPFLISARLEWHRNPELQAFGDSPIREFLRRLVTDAIRAGELTEDTEIEAVTDLLQVILYGMAFHSAFTDTHSDLGPITQQLVALFAKGLVPASRHGRAVTAPQC
jgi:AcrR family transcriptional regulator